MKLLIVGSRSITDFDLSPYNQQMVDMANSVLIIWDGCSKGTQYTLDYSKKMKKPIILIQLQNDD